MVSPTLTDEMREQVRAIIGRCVVDAARRPASPSAASPTRELRAEILVAIAVGISLTRASGTLPALAGAARAISSPCSAGRSPTLQDDAARTRPDERRGAIGGDAPG